MNNEAALANMYKVFMSTQLIELDIKSIRKINNTYLKYTRTGKEIYVLEIYNILLGLSNHLDLKEAEQFILYYIEEDIREKISFIIKKVK